MITPKVSIIIPLYNHAQALAQCLQSIKNQTFQDYEIIIVNDGSTDIKPMQLESTIKQFVKNREIKLASIAQPIRIALTGNITSPGIFHLLTILGKKESFSRIEALIK